jgi:hypothetical protein
VNVDSANTRLCPGHDAILVELASHEQAENLCDRLSRDRVTWPERAESCWVVSIEFDSGAELARLLRKIEAWVADRALGAIRYHLDGRAYVLGAGEIAWSTFATVSVRL